MGIGKEGKNINNLPINRFRALQETIESNTACKGYNLQALSYKSITTDGKTNNKI